MNCYFLVEGRRTERKIYPAWIEALFPSLQRISYAYHVSENNYYLLSGGGQPSILNHLVNAINEVNEIKKFNKLILVMDAEDNTVSELHQVIKNHLKNKGIDKSTFFAEFILIVQNRTIETWLLGNRKLFKRNPINSELSRYISFYNVSDHDPELMGRFETFSTHAAFHEQYLKLIFLERNIRYSKKNPGEALKIEYYHALCDRVLKEPDDLKSFQALQQLFDEIKNKLIQ